MPNFRHRKISSSAAKSASKSSPRRIWVRRSGFPATSVFVRENQLVDDLKSLILLKYPTTLCKQCDPADLILELVTMEEDVNTARRTSRSMSSADEDQEQEQGLEEERVAGPRESFLSMELQPYENVFEILDNYFPKGMSMNNALLVSQSVAALQQSHVAGLHPVHETLSASPDQIISTMPSTQAQVPMNLHMQVETPGDLTAMMDGGFTLQEPIIANDDIGILPSMTDSGQDIALSSNEPSAALNDSGGNAAISDDEDLDKFDVDAPPLTANGHRNSNSSHNSSMISRGKRSNSNVTGVLLLPRQFKLPGSEDHGDDKANGNDSGNENENDQENPEQSLPAENGDDEDSDDLGHNDKQEGEESSDPDADKQAVAQDHPKSEKDGKSETGGATSNGLASVKQLGTRVMKKLGQLKFPVLDGVVPKIHVLIVEDNVINQKILEAFMRRKRIRCGVARNGKEAVDKWRQGGYHLVLMDLQLPVMSGLDATKEIRRLENANRIGKFSTDSSEDDTEIPELKPEDQLDKKLFKAPVIIVALTASSSSSDKQQALSVGCNDFLTKPVNLIWLEQKTIEWGCMQALIDFDGWKEWIGREDSYTGKSGNASATTPQSSTPGVHGGGHTHTNNKTNRWLRRGRSHSRSGQTSPGPRPRSQSGKHPIIQPLTSPTTEDPNVRGRQLLKEAFS